MEKIDKELLEVLACPYCKGDLEYYEKSNVLVCKKCGKEFKIENGIPIML